MPGGNRCGRILQHSYAISSEKQIPVFFFNFLKQFLRWFFERLDRLLVLSSENISIETTYVKEPGTMPILNAPWKPLTIGTLGGSSMLYDPKSWIYCCLYGFPRTTEEERYVGSTRTTHKISSDCNFWTLLVTIFRFIVLPYTTRSNETRQAKNWERSSSRTKQRGQIRGTERC